MVSIRKVKRVQSTNELLKTKVKDERTEARNEDIEGEELQEDGDDERKNKKQKRKEKKEKKRLKKLKKKRKLIEAQIEMEMKKKKEKKKEKKKKRKLREQDVLEEDINVKKRRKLDTVRMIEKELDLEEKQGISNIQSDDDDDDDNDDDDDETQRFSVKEDTQDHLPKRKSKKKPILNRPKLEVNNEDEHEDTLNPSIEINTESDGPPKKLGKFTKEETETICQSVKDFCNSKNISVESFCSLGSKKCKVSGGWQQIAKCLPYRSPQSIYRHGVRQLHAFNRGPWTEEECQMLVHFVKIKGSSWAVIQEKLNRTSQSCRDKYRELCNSTASGPWTKEEVKKFKSLIRDYAKVDSKVSMEEVRERVDKKELHISWESISKRMETRSRLTCFTKWKLLSKASTPSSSKKTRRRRKSLHVDDSDTDNSDPTIHPLRNDIQLLTKIADSGASRESDYDWSSPHTSSSALQRWDQLVVEWHNQDLPTESQMSLPTHQIAKILLERLMTKISEDENLT